MVVFKPFLLKLLASLLVIGISIGCDSSKQKEKEDKIQDADKTKMMEEEHQMDPIEGELFKEDTVSKKDEKDKK